jgi:hypothetical protein
MQAPVPQLRHAFWKSRDGTLKITGSANLSLESVYHLLRECMRLGMGCVSIHLAHWPVNIRIDSELASVRYAMAVTLNRTRYLVVNPFSDAPLWVRYVLANSDIEGVINHLVFGIAHELEHSSGISELERKHPFYMYRYIIHSVVCPEVDIGGSIRRVVEDHFDPVWKIQDPLDYPLDHKPFGFDAFTGLYTTRRL